MGPADLLLVPWRCDAQLKGKPGKPGKPPFSRLVVHLKGDAEATKEKQVPQPYLRRTFKGTTAELMQTIRDGLAGKKVPDVDPKEKPGLGPEVNQSKIEKRGTRNEMEGPAVPVHFSFLISRFSFLVPHRRSSPASSSAARWPCWPCSFPLCSAAWSFSPLDRRPFQNPVPVGFRKENAP